jgi:hypothetical protein
MPIRLNILAEAQAAEEMRRRDPVKRAIWTGCLLVAGMLVWSSSVYVNTLMARNDLNTVQAAIASRSNEFSVVQAQLKKINESKGKLAALQQLTTNRFLNGNLLDALQQVTVNDVALMQVKVNQAYLATEAVKDKTNSSGKITRGKPATIKESIVVTLDARDSGPVPGDQVNKYKDALTTNVYFQAELSKTNGVRLTFVGSPTIAPDAKPFVLFTVECRYPEQTR